MSENYLNNIQFIFSSKIRFNLLLNLYNEDKTLKELEVSLNSGTTTILHKIKDLINLGLVKKEDKLYSLTVLGLIFVSNFIQTSENCVSWSLILNFGVNIL